MIKKHELSFCTIEFDTPETVEIRELPGDHPDRKSIRIKAERAIPFSMRWDMPREDVVFRWTSLTGKAGSGLPPALPPSWACAINSDLVRNMPVIAFVAQGGENRLTVSVSDSSSNINMSGGIDEHSFRINCRISGRIEKNAAGNFELTAYIDRRKIPFTSSVRTALETMDHGNASAIPADAFSPVYSTWYAFHRDMNRSKIEAECKIASEEYGLRTVILDDGFQNMEQNSAEGYADCGDWQLDHDKFPGMAEHVKCVQSLGMKYMLWIALPFIGEKSRAYHRFKNKLLYHSPGMNVHVADPRYPDVRAYMIETCVSLVERWHLDGLKIDFLDRFYIEDSSRQKGASPGSGRDYESVPAAVESLCAEISRRLSVLNKEILIEFRQEYISPSIRRFCNMMRVSDCPGDYLSNRVRSLNLRTLCSGTAIHSDMLGWALDTTPETAALQLWNVIFSVPQISVKLSELPPSHREMLGFVLQVWQSFRDCLLHGSLRRPAPELNDPLVYAENGNETVTACYSASTIIEIPESESLLLINATGTGHLTIRTSRPICGESFDCRGRQTGARQLSPGIHSLPIEPSGIFISGTPFPG